MACPYKLMFAFGLKGKSKELVFSAMEKKRRRLFKTKLFVYSNLELLISEGAKSQPYGVSSSCAVCWG